MVGERNLGSGDVFRPGSAGKGLALPSNNTNAVKAGRAAREFGTAFWKHGVYK